MTTCPKLPNERPSGLRRTASGPLFESRQLVVEDFNVVKRKAGVSETSQRHISQPSSTSRSQCSQPTVKAASIPKSKAPPTKPILHTPRQPPEFLLTDLVHATVLDLHGRPIQLDQPPPVLRRTASGRLFKSSQDFIKRPEMEGPRPCSIGGLSTVGYVRYELPLARESRAKRVEVTCNEDSELLRRSYAAVFEIMPTEELGEQENRKDSAHRVRQKGRRRPRPVSEDVWMQVAGD